MAIESCSARSFRQVEAWKFVQGEVYPSLAHARYDGVTATSQDGASQARQSLHGDFMGILGRVYFASVAAAACVLLCACTATSPARNSGDPTARKNAALEAIIDAQLAAYNRRDVEGFLSHYSDDAKLFDYPNQPTESGKDQLRARYTRSFANKEIRAEIVDRIVFDRFVIDHERITGRPDGTSEAVAVYELKDGKIVAVTFLKP